MKLSKAQRALLTDLAAGAVVHYFGGKGARFMLARENGMASGLNPATVTRLQRAGLIERYMDAPHALDPSYRITKAGRDALEIRHS